MLAKLPQADPEARSVSPGFSALGIEVVPSRFLREHQAVMVAQDKTIALLGAGGEPAAISSVSCDFTKDGTLYTYRVTKGYRSFVKTIFIPLRSAEHYQSAIVPNS